MVGQYIFLKDSSLKHYNAEAYTLRCFDDRFWKTFKLFLKSKGIKHIDPASVAGGVKVLAEPEKKTDRDFILREIEKSVRLHHTSRIILFSHHDCGALGGMAKFNSNRDEELAYHKNLHQKAKVALAAKFPNLQVETYFIDDKGVMEIS